MVAKSLTALDKSALLKILKCGFVSVALDGDPGLETDTQITAWRLRRLIELDYLTPGNDGLFGTSQTYLPSEKARKINV